MKKSNNQKSAKVCPVLNIWLVIKVGCLLGESPIAQIYKHEFSCVIYRFKVSFVPSNNRTALPKVCTSLTFPQNEESP